VRSEPKMTWCTAETSAHGLACEDRATIKAKSLLPRSTQAALLLQRPSRLRREPQADRHNNAKQLVPDHCSGARPFNMPEVVAHRTDQCSLLPAQRAEVVPYAEFMMRPRP
jgi:hypothetical protein